MQSSGRIITMCIVACVLTIGFDTGLADQDVSMPGEAVMRSIKQLLPGGRIEEIEFERRIIQLYDITVVIEGRAVEVTVMDDGTVLNLEQEIDPDSLPDPVAMKLKELKGEGRLTEVERVELHGEIRAVSLEHTVVEYEAELRIGGRERLVRLSGDGLVVDAPKDALFDND